MRVLLGTKFLLQNFSQFMTHKKMAHFKVVFSRDLFKLLAPVSRFEYLHKKQSGGSGQYGRVSGFMEELPPEDYQKVEFDNRTTGTNVPRPFIPAIEKVGGNSF